MQNNKISVHDRNVPAAHRDEVGPVPLKIAEIEPYFRKINEIPVEDFQNISDTEEYFINNEHHYNHVKAEGTDISTNSTWFNSTEYKFAVLQVRAIFEKIHMVFTRYKENSRNTEASASKAPSEYKQYQSITNDLPVGRRPQRRKVTAK